MKSNKAQLLGRKIQMERDNRGWTLRELAAKTQLSHSYINRIEQGRLTPSEEALESLKSALNFTYKTSCDCQMPFQELARQLHRNLLYGNYIQAVNIGEKIYARREEFEQCPCYASYYLYMLACTQHTRKFRELRQPYYEKLNKIENIFEGDEKALYMFEKGLYFYYVHNDRQQAITILKAVESLTQDENLIAFANFFLGTLYSQDYRYYRHSLEAFDYAQRLYQNQNNFIRVMHTKSNKQMLYIYLNRFEDFEQINAETINYAKIKGEVVMYIVSLKNRAKYFIARREPEKALEVLNRYTDEQSAEDYFYKIYALYRLGIHVQALHTIQVFDKLDLSGRNIIYRYGSDAIKHAITQGDDEALIDRLKLFADKAFEHKEFMLIRIAFKLVSENLKNHRRYKEAYDYSNTLLEVVKEIIGKDVHHEKLS